MKKTYADICLERAENAPLRSDDHGHDTGALRDFCEEELMYAYDVMVPELCKRLNKACEYIRDLDFDSANRFAEKLERTPEERGSETILYNV